MVSQHHQVIAHSLSQPRRLKGTSRGDAEYLSMLESAGLQPKVKRCGGGYRDTRYTADELLEVAASLGIKLRQAREEIDELSVALRTERASRTEVQHEGEAFQALVNRLEGEREALLETIQDERREMEDLRLRAAGACKLPHDVYPILHLRRLTFRARARTRTQHTYSQHTHAQHTHAQHPPSLQVSWKRPLQSRLQLLTSGALSANRLSWQLQSTRRN